MMEEGVLYNDEGSIREVDLCNVRVKLNRGGKKMFSRAQSMLNMALEILYCIPGLVGWYHVRGRGVKQHCLCFLNCIFKKPMNPVVLTDIH